jgi:hypothetical protein
VNNFGLATSISGETGIASLYAFDEGDPRSPVDCLLELLVNRSFDYWIKSKNLPSLMRQMGQNDL